MATLYVTEPATQGKVRLLQRNLLHVCPFPLS